MITRDNIRTLKPLSDATLKAKQESSITTNARNNRIKTPFSPMEEALKSVNANVNKHKPIAIPIQNMSKAKVKQRRNCESV